MAVRRLPPSSFNVCVFFPLSVGCYWSSGSVRSRSKETFRFMLSSGPERSEESRAEPKVENVIHMRGVHRGAILLLLVTSLLHTCLCCKRRSQLESRAQLSAQTSAAAAPTPKLLCCCYNLAVSPDDFRFAFLTGSPLAVWCQNICVDTTLSVCHT